jgi:hypothetical protein
MLRSTSGVTFATATIIRVWGSTTFASKVGTNIRSLKNLYKKNPGVQDPGNEVAMLSAQLYQSTDLGNGCSGTRALNDAVCRLAESKCVLLGHLRLTEE